jgi:amino acid permease
MTPQDEAIHEQPHDSTNDVHVHPPTSDDPEDALLLSQEAVSANNYEERQGTISSARLNILSTMVGGGSLSLPLAFQKSGNFLLGPLLIVIVACFSDFCFRVLVASAGEPTAHTGTASFESIASAAFGAKAQVVSMGLVFFMCLIGSIGYAVLLRDMLVPIADALSPNPSQLYHNAAMLTIVLLVTPLTTLQTLTSLKRFGAASMFSVFTLGCCVIYRSIQCNFGDHMERHADWFHYIRLFPESPKDLLDALPLFVSCFVCHYNICTVHNELKDPTPARSSWWIRSTTWSAAIFYLSMGLAGSMYGNCTPSGKVQGNVLLDFGEDDPLLLMGRLCLALTITLAFPMLIIPARDIILRVLTPKNTDDDSGESLLEEGEVLERDLQEPLLGREEPKDESVSFGRRLAVAILVFWSAAGIACCVSSIDIVWDLLGSSLSILLSYLIPCGSYLVLMDQHEDLDAGDGSDWTKRLSRAMCWFLLILFIPLMFILTVNAVYNTALTL